jgi:hypothetical protein
LRVIGAEHPRVGRAIALAAVLALSIVASTPSSAFGGTGEEINALPTLDALNRSEEPLSNGGKWASLAWASSPSGRPTGRDTPTGWGPYDTFPTVNGAFWKPSGFVDKPGGAAAMTMEVAPGPAGTYLSLWLDMQSPTSAKSGYQLRWTATATAGTYSLTLIKWFAGSQIPLASNSSVSIPASSTLAISDVGGTVSAWLGSKGSLLPILSAEDSTYASGYAGIEGSGPLSRVMNFKAGVLGTSASTGVPLLDNLERQEAPLATGKWSKTVWAGSIGTVSCCSPGRGYGSSTGVSGAFWNPAAFTEEGEGARVAAMIGSAASLGQSFSLWLDMPAPGSSRWGYEAKFSGAGGETYKAELARWVFGTRALIGSTSVSLPVGSVVALSDRGEKVEVAGGSGALAPVISVNDTGNNSGFAGLEVSGPGPTLYNFRAGSIDLQAPDTTITAGPSGSVTPKAVSFTFAASEAGASLECSLDGSPYAGCSSPKAYPTIARGAHTFRVRATDSRGNVDPTPAERAFSVITPPTATTSPATGVTSNAATLKAAVNPNGLETSYQFEYGTTLSYGSTIPATAKSVGAGTTSVEASQPITGLTPGTAYHFRISATNVDGTTKGTNGTFTTTAAPVVSTGPPSDITANSATLKASVNPRGAATTYQFEYGPTTAYGSKAPASPQAAGSGYSSIAVSAAVSGLAENATYHVRVVATNAVGTTYGKDTAFTTLALPEATTETGDAATANEAIIEGTVDPNGSETSYRVQYGPTTAYGQESPVGLEDLDVTVEDAEIVEPLVHLKPQTTYHYRFVATSPAGTDYGQDRTFTTGAAQLSPQQEAEQEEEERDFTGKFVPPPGSQFAGVHQHGNHFSGAQAKNELMNAAAHSGAKWIRVLIHSHVPPSHLEEIFAKAANRGLKVLPYYEIGKTAPAPSVEEEAKTYLTNTIKKYGPTGWFWDREYTETNPPIKISDMPAYVWEIGNEPNRGEGQRVDPVGFGKFFANLSNAAKETPNVRVLLAGLYSADANRNGDQCASKRNCVMTVTDFVTQMGQFKSYDALSLHPYAFKVNDARPTVDNRNRLIDKIHGKIVEAREVLRDTNPGMEIWITEFGFPTDYGAGEELEKEIPAVGEGLQRLLIEDTFNKVKAIRTKLNIVHLFYFNLQEYTLPAPAPAVHWPYGTGLRKKSGKNKAGWVGFALEANGNEWWPRPTKHKKPDTTQGRPQFADVEARIDTDGVTASYYFEYRKKQTTQVSTSAVATAQAIEGDQTVAGRLTNLSPNTEYEYRSVATNENEDTTAGAEWQTLKTEPMANTTATFTHLNGEPGWASVHGWSKYDGLGINGTVRIFFDKGDANSKKEIDVPVSNGQFRLDNYPLGRGSWTAWATFLPSGTYPGSTTNTHNFTMRNGYRLVAKHSQKCLDVYQGMTGEGAPLIQYGCDPQVPLNQVFQLVPMDNQARYQIVARHSNRCVGVPAGTQAPHQLSQTNCVGAAHQIWQGQTVQPNGDDNTYNRFVVQHSGQCMDVFNSSGDNGAMVGQYPCNGAQGNQLWTFQSVDAGQVPTQTYLTNEPNNTYHGMPGMVSFHGHLTAGDRAYPLAGRKVHVLFDRANAQGTFDEIPDSSVAVDVDATGYYSYKYWGLWEGNWRAWAVFYGTGDALAQSVSGLQPVTINKGYRLMFRSTKKCLATQNNGTANGTHMVQKTCNTGSTPLDGQVFSLWPAAPIGANHWQLRPNTASNPPSNAQCVDVNAAQQENHAEINLYQCVGAANQTWDFPELPYPNREWFVARAQHSGKCMDVPGGNETEGLQIRQFECLWNGNQQFAWKIVP